VSKGSRVIVAVGIVLFAAYLLIPTSKSVRINFWTRASGTDFTDPPDLRLEINDHAVGGADVTLDLTELKSYFVPELAPSNWPPEDSAPPSYDPVITKDLTFEVRVRKANTAPERKTHVVFVRVVDGDDVTTGAFRLTAVRSDGDTALFAGIKLKERAVEDKRVSATVQLQLHF